MSAALLSPRFVLDSLISSFHLVLSRVSALHPRYPAHPYDPEPLDPRDTSKSRLDKLPRHVSYPRASAPASQTSSRLRNPSRLTSPAPDPIPTPLLFCASLGAYGPHRPRSPLFRSPLHIAWVRWSTATTPSKSTCGYPQLAKNPLTAAASFGDLFSPAPAPAPMPTPKYVSPL